MTENTQAQVGFHISHAEQLSAGLFAFISAALIFVDLNGGSVYAVLNIGYNGMSWFLLHALNRHGSKTLEDVMFAVFSLLILSRFSAAWSMPTPSGALPLVGDLLVFGFAVVGQKQRLRS